MALLKVNCFGWALLSAVGAVCLTLLWAAIFTDWTHR